MPPSYCTSLEGSHSQVYWTDGQLPAGINGSKNKKKSTCGLCLISAAVCESCCRRTVALVYISYRARCLGRPIEAARYSDGGGVEGRGGQRSDAEGGSGPWKHSRGVRSKYICRQISQDAQPLSCASVCVVCCFSCICEMLQSFA